MSPEMIGILGVVVLFILIMCRMWIGVALGLVGFVGIIVMRGFTQGMSVLGDAPFTNITTYSITVLPMFTLMGMIIAESTIGKNMFKVGYNWIGDKPGGLASATVIASGFIGAICGSHMVGTVIMTKIALPEMKRYNYDEGLATATIASGAPLSIILPPSMPLILYGILTEQNIGQLFMSGIIPGIMIIIVFIAIITIKCARNEELGPRGDSVSWGEKFRSLVGVIPVIALFVIVLGGIYMGFFTTTESGAIGTVFAIIIAIITKSLNGKKMIVALKETALTVCMMLFMLAGTYIFIVFVTLSKLPFLLSNLIVSMEANYWLIMIAIGVLFIFLGIILPEITIVALTVPILFPALMAVGFDPIWLGIFITLMMALGAITPPIGMTVFIIGGMTGIPIMKIFNSCWPFIIGDMIVIILIAIFPSLATFIPYSMVA